MSANLVTKTLIDLLVTAAVKWRDHGQPWSYYWLPRGSRIVTEETASDVGTMLWRANWDITEGWLPPGERDLPRVSAYVFDPLPGIPDPLLVLKQISYYHYQSAGDDVAGWRLSEPAAFLDALRETAIGKLAGYEERPWGVGDEHRQLFLRLGGPDLAGEPVPADADDPEWVAVNDLLSRTGLPFEAADRQVRRQSLERGDDLLLHGSWLARWPGARFPTARANLYGTERDARAGFDRGLSAARGGGRMPRWAAVLRSGRAVVAFFQHPSNPEHDSWFDRIWTAFPDPDQVWVEASAHEPVTGAAVLADRVAFTAGFEGLVPVFVIRTPGARQRLMEFVEDDEVREKVAAVNLRKHSLVVLNTIGTLSLRGYAEMLDQGQLSTETKPRRSLRLGVDDLRQKTGTMLIVDRLPAEPDDVFLDGTRPGAPGYSVLLPSGHLWVPRRRRE